MSSAVRAHVALMLAAAAAVAPFPVVESSSTGGTSGATSLAVSLPSGVTAGDLLLLVICNDGLQSPSTSNTKWWPVRQGTQTNGNGDNGFGIFFRIADGVNDATDITISSSDDFRYVCHRISNANLVTGTFQTAGIPAVVGAHTPEAGSKDYLWMCAVGTLSTGVVSAIPGDWTNLVSAGTGTDSSCATYQKAETGTTITPGAFTTTAANTARFCATLAIHPIITGGDPFFAQQMLLLHFNGTNGATSTADVMGRIPTMQSGSTLVTADAKFGSAGFNQNAFSHGVWNTPARNFDFGTDDFCIEGWFRTPPSWGAASWHTFFAICDNSTYSIWMAFDSSGVLYSEFKSTGGAAIGTISGGSALSTSTYYFFSLSRQGSAFKFFVDGTQKGSTLTSASTLRSGSGYSFRLGSDTGSFGRWRGAIDEVRVVRGAAVRTANFTPPAGEFLNY